MTLEGRFIITVREGLAMATFKTWPLWLRPGEGHLIEANAEDLEGALEIAAGKLRERMEEGT